MLVQINASAGSGKTYTLTRRFLELLRSASPAAPFSGCAVHGRLSGYSLPEILAATFTNKAAAEMKSRVVSTLKEAALAEAARIGAAARASDDFSTPSPRPGSLQAKEARPYSAEFWVETILRHYNSLNIRTIDSLLATLVRLSALELGLPPDFAPSFDAAEYFTPHYDSLMENLSAYSRQQTPLEASPDGSPEWSPEVPPEERTEALHHRQYEGPQQDAAPALSSTGEAPVFHTGDGAALCARLSEACTALLYLGEFNGFALKGRLHGQIFAIVERIMRGEETPDMDQSALHAKVTALHGRVVEANAALLAMLEKEALAATKNFLSYTQKCAGVRNYRPLPQSVYQSKSELDECLNKSSRGSASAFAEKAFADAFAANAAYAQALPLLTSALSLAPLVALARELLARMTAPAALGILPATLLPILAGRLLSGEHGVSDALCRFGSRLSQILLDEFQDTSREQWAAILPLAEESLATGGSLTYVGDVKQAIYGWRGGDARLFHEVASESSLTALSPAPEYIPLAFNWRSHPAIVEHNNAFFALLSEEAIAQSVLEAMLPPHTPERFVQSGAELLCEHFSSARQSIPPQKTWQNDEKSAAAGVCLYVTEGENVAALVENVRLRLQRLFAEELLPNWNYGDIAILVRSGEEAALAANWLTEWSVPVVTENSFLLSSHPVIGRLVSFLTFLDYPLDDIAFWEFISGPECLDAFTQDAAAWGEERTKNGEEENGETKNNESEKLTPRFLDWLTRIRAEFPSERPPLYRLFRRDFPAIWRRFIEPFYAQAGLMSAYDTLSEAVARFAIAQRLPGQGAFIRRFLELAHTAEKRGHSSLAAFLAFWRSCSENEKLPLPENMNAVRIMTIHKAKGLEFPVVVLPFQHKAQTRQPALAAITVEGLRLLTRAGRELPDDYYPALLNDELERLNLLYVAWTRPVYALHAFITRPQSRPTPLSKALEVLCACYEERHGAELCRWEYPSADDGEHTPPASIPAPAPAPENAPGKEAAYEAKSAGAADTEAPAADAKMPAADAKTPAYEDTCTRFDVEEEEPWRPMRWLPRLKIYRSPLPAPGFTARQRGILMHLCLEHLILTPKAPPMVVAMEAARAVRQGIRLFPLPLDEPERVAEEMREGLAWFAALPQAATWLSKGRREQGIMDENGRMHRVDLLAQSAAHKGALDAVDYKTGLAREEYAEQVGRYMRLACAATGKTVHGYIVYLDEKKLVHIAPPEAPEAPVPPVPPEPQQAPDTSKNKGKGAV